MFFLDRPFYELAATLIPVFLFGGVLLNRSDLGSDWGIWALIILGALAVYAEVTAISGALSGSISDFNRYVVALTLVIGMVSVYLGAVLPMLSKWRTWTELPQIGKIFAGIAVAAVVLSAGREIVEAAHTRRVETALQLEGGVYAEMEAITRRTGERLQKTQSLSLQIERLLARNRLTPFQQQRLKILRTTLELEEKLQMTEFTRVIHLNNRSIRLLNP
jgi:hypothetical protein